MLTEGFCCCKQASSSGRDVGATLHCVQASHCAGFLCCGARGLGMWAQ